MQRQPSAKAVLRLKSIGKALDGLPQRHLPGIEPKLSDLLPPRFANRFALTLLPILPQLHPIYTHFDFTRREKCGLRSKRVEKENKWRTLS
jgi:hypothetical protein